MLSKDAGNKHDMNKNGVRRSDEQVTASLMHVKADKEECMAWYRRLGHPSFNTLKKLIPTISKHTDECLICSLAKETRVPFPLSMTRSTCIIGLYHIVVWGPYGVKTHANECTTKQTRISLCEC